MADYKRRKPTPKTQSELTREQLEAYDTTRGTVPASSKLNRELNYLLSDLKISMERLSITSIM
jgi:hypothetical protein